MTAACESHKRGREGSLAKNLTSKMTSWGGEGHDILKMHETIVLFPGSNVTKIFRSRSIDLLYITAYIATFIILCHNAGEEINHKRRERTTEERQFGILLT